MPPSRVFWGYERDNGKRSHEGIDIFAKRGTPVLAVTNGTISRTGDMGLGGKQVWQRSGLFGNSIYYAHLDSIAVREGMKVAGGDTLGFVGNTGNAAGGPAHLHFGIYKGFGGAINPLPFVFETKKVTAAGFSEQFKSGYLKIKTKNANLRQQPDANSAILGTLNENDTVVLIGESNDWIHVSAKNKKALVHQSVVREIK